MQLSFLKKSEVSKKQLIIETIIVLLITVVPALFIPELKGTAVFIPLVYIIFINGWLRKTKWSEMGIRPKTFFLELKRFWWLVILVGVFIQVTVVFAAKAWMPQFLTHILARLPFSTTIGWGPVIVSLLLATFVEELVYRGLFQKRFGLFMPVNAAILLVSLIFSLLHWAGGPIFVIIVDVFLIFIDSVLYGFIYERSGNLLIAWLAHFLADVVGLWMLSSLIS
jgi:membrane protease YdiL (CAAX protease family)